MATSQENAAAYLSSDTPINVLVLGNGGREDALTKKLAASPRTAELIVAPGNGGSQMRATSSLPFDITSPLMVAEVAKQHRIGLVVIGPEAPLVAGVADATRAAGIPTFGPSKKAAKMEGSKKFAKSVMDRAGVPTAAWQSFNALQKEKAEAYLDQVGAPVVVKADGLAAGKGVVVAETLEQAHEALDSCFDGSFGEAGDHVVIEEFLRGPEVSMLVLTDGATVVPLAASQDHKRALDGDLGPNTGGMGVYSPVPFVEDKEYNVMVKAMKRVVRQLADEGTPYTGCLYGGFMLTAEGPKILEFNARFGDPETQVVLPRMKGDLVEAFLACEAGTLSDVTFEWDDDYAVSVVLTSAGYPGSYETGFEITGIEAAEALEGVSVYHAGDKREGDKLLTSGGRVLNVTAVAPTFQAARDRAYEACELINFQGKTLRSDIAARALAGRDAWEV